MLSFLVRKLVRYQKPPRRGKETVWFYIILRITEYLAFRYYTNCLIHKLDRLRHALQPSLVPFDMNFAGFELWPVSLYVHRTSHEDVEHERFDRHNWMFPREASSDVLRPSMQASLSSAPQRLGIPSGMCRCTRSSCIPIVFRIYGPVWISILRFGIEGNSFARVLNFQTHYFTKRVSSEVIVKYNIRGGVRERHSTAIVTSSVAWFFGTTAERSFATR